MAEVQVKATQNRASIPTASKVCFAGCLSENLFEKVPPPVLGYRFSFLARLISDILTADAQFSGTGSPKTFPRLVPELLRPAFLEFRNYALQGIGGANINCRRF